MNHQKTHPHKYLLICLLYSIPLVTSGETKDHIDHSHHMEMMKNKDKVFNITHETYELPDTALTSSNGTNSRLIKELDTDKPVILNFIFTTCTAICPIMSGTFAEINHALSNKSVKMISISIDPEYDTPKTLRAYAKKFNANKNWNFFTGTTENIITTQRAFSEYRGNKMNHEPNTFFRPSKNSKWIKISGFISSNEFVKLYEKNN